MAIIHPVGDPENESERQAIAHLRAHLSDSYHIYHNLELPNHYGFPYEYDLIVVGEYAVYMVEVKGYDGVIRGNAATWEFESGATMPNPMPLANKKAKIINSHLERFDRTLEAVYVIALVILTGDKIKIELEDSQARRVLNLAQAVNFIKNPKSLPIANPALIAPLVPKITQAITKQFRPLHRSHEIGDYRVVETIGKNNLYTTFLAEHRWLKGRFVLKVYNFDLYTNQIEQDKQKQRSLREANALHQLGVHANLTQVHPPFAWQHNQIVVPLSWVDGYTLRGLLESHYPFDLPTIFGILAQVTKGLAYAHQHGVVHRDICPDNIIIPKNDSIVKVVNFDCARLEQGDWHTIASRMGRELSPHYQAPEVSANVSEASPASDQYSLGIVAFQLLTGELPYEKIGEVRRANGLPRLPSSLNPALSSRVDTVLQKMCAFNPTDRYDTVRQAITELITP